MIWAGFLGSSMTTHKGLHLRPEIADKLWPLKYHGVFNTARHLLTAAFCFGATWYGYLYVFESFELADINPILNLKLWVVQIIIPLTFLSSGVRALVYALMPKLRPAATRGSH